MVVRSWGLTIRLVGRGDPICDIRRSIDAPCVLVLHLIAIVDLDRIRKADSPIGGAVMTIPQTVSVQANTPAGTWTIRLPLTESEQFFMSTNECGATRTMRATDVSVYRRWSDSPAVFLFQGPEINRNGSPGSRHLGSISNLEEFSSRCPLTYVEVVKAGEMLIEQIRRQSDRAVEEIRGAFVSRLR